ncbi:MAG: Rrf2 family transcriptional regulator [Gemmatimonadetes bacterium]|nr:Rrf2 family transcriptional regulator [Gemmatimonadota bacterium]
MRVTTWAEYGLIVAVHLARRDSDAPMPARELAGEEGLPADYVEQILLKLRRAGIVRSARGARGGYTLARPAETVSVRDVIEAAEHRTFQVNCDSHQVRADRCAPHADCAIRPVWRALQLRIDQLLDSVSLADLSRGEAAVEELVSQSV